MNSRTIALLVFLSLCSPLLLFPQADNERAITILKESSEALQKVTSVSYEYKYEGYGKYNGHFTGTVEMTGTLPGMNIYVDMRSLNKAGDKVKREEITITAGQQVSLTDHKQRTFRYGTMAGGSVHLSSYATYAVISEYVHPQPFTGNMNNPTLSHDGDTTLNGRLLDKVSFKNQFGDKMTYFIGRSDRMIYAQQAENTNGDEEGGFFFTIERPDLEREIDKKRFSPQPPQDFESIDEDKRELAVGAKAPGWFLQSLDGDYRRAMDYKGKVVVLDFWASWCKPCWQIMPIVDEVKQNYSDTEVQVFGVNVWEKPELDVKAYLQKKGYEYYETLVDKEARTAKNYKIYSLPLVVVIGKDGHIRYMNRGLSQNLKEELTKAIDKALEE